MNRRLALAAALGLSTGLGATTSAQTPAPGPASKGTTMTQHAAGTFDVKMQPLPADEKVPGLKVARYGIEKQWKGGFEGTSRAEMMATGSPQGSGAYVAIEHMAGTLNGRSGSFTVVHRGNMRNPTDYDLIIDVVPGSGTDRLAGISGRVKIVIADGKHSYEIDYTLPD